MVGAVEGEVAQRGELGLDPVQPGRVRRGVGDLDVVRRRPASDGPLLDELADSSIDQYCVTMERLMALPVAVVHAGHDPSFGRDRLRQLAAAYLQRRCP